MLDSRPDAFGDRNHFHHAVMGLVSLCLRFDRALAVESPADEETVSPDDPWLLCVLGAVAFRRKFGAIVATARPDERESPARDPGSTSDLRDLLR